MDAQKKTKNMTVSGRTISLYDFVEGTRKLRSWEKEFVPFSSPQIALDIALYATAARLKNRLVVSKSVHLTVGYSSDRVREVLGALVADGWIEKTEHPSDRRIRLIQASDKLVDLMSEYKKQSRSCIGDCACGLTTRVPIMHLRLNSG